MTKEEILSSILPLASRKGLRNLSLSEIAENAGIKKSSLYSHFSSKEDIIDSLYLFLRKKANSNRDIGQVDYGMMVEGKTMRKALEDAVSAYRAIIDDEEMNAFYRIVSSEKAFSPIASRIIVEETRTMVGATKNLFYVMKAKGMADFPSVEGAALVFSMAVHSILELTEDDRTAGTKLSEKIMEEFLDEFSSSYGKEA